VQGEAVGMTPKDDQRSQSPAPLRGDRALADAPSAHLTDGIDIEAEGDRPASNGATGAKLEKGKLKRCWLEARDYVATPCGPCSA